MKSLARLACVAVFVAFVARGATGEDLDIPPSKSALPAAPVLEDLGHATAQQKLSLAGIPAWQPPKFAPARNLDCNGRSGRAVLSTESTRLVLGRGFNLKVRFESGSSGYFYNVFFDRLDFQPAILALFDKQHEYVGNFFFYDYLPHSFAGPRANSWTYVPSGCAVEAAITLRAGYLIVSGRGFPDTVSRGTYYLQMIYDSSFLTPCCVCDGQIQYDQFFKLFHEDRKSDIFRSNVLEIELIDERDELPGE